MLPGFGFPLSRQTLPIGTRSVMMCSANKVGHVTGKLVVAACGPSRGIGRKGDLPWPKLASDLAHFKRLTTSNAVIMGRVTYESIPAAQRPLPNRLNVVISSKDRATLGLPDTVLLASSLSGAEKLLLARGISSAFIIGGYKLFKEALDRPRWSERVFYTHIDQEFEADVVFPTDLDKSPDFSLISVSDRIKENNVSYEFREYKRTNTSNRDPDWKGVKCMMSNKERHEEYQYLDLVRRILQSGVSKEDRTGVGTLSIFGAQMRFNLRDGRFPLLTTKRVFFRGVAEELLWFIRGSTNGNDLAEKNVHIWDGNGSREFLDKSGFTEREVGDLGPVYGFQWRHFGAEYRTMHDDYSNQGVDQLADVVDKIKHRPYDRRIILSAWNPVALKEMALPPCHMFCQFYVANGELSCQMYQRSCDMGLGVPFNIASYALLTCLVADVCGLTPGDFVHVLGDAHVYNNHVDSLRKQIEREPRPFPTLKIRNNPHKRSIEDFVYEDFELCGYDPHKTIKMKMAL